MLNKNIYFYVISYHLSNIYNIDKIRLFCWCLILIFQKYKIQNSLLWLYSSKFPTNQTSKKHYLIQEIYNKKYIISFT